MTLASAPERQDERIVADERLLTALKPRGNRRHVLSGAGTVVVLGLAALLVQQLVANEAFEWDVVGRYLFDPYVIEGLLTTIRLTALSMAIAIVIALIVANMRLSRNRVLSSVGAVYVWFFRSIPTLVLLILWFNFAVLYPRFVLGVPFGPELMNVSMNEVINPFWAAVAAFGLQQAAYTSEVIRAALVAVPKGQREAAHALGMTKRRAFAQIIAPQAFRIAVPPISNDTINLLKGTTLVAFISVADLLYSAQQIYNRTYEIIPLLLVASIWYMALVTVLSIGQQLIENRLTRGRAAPGRPRSGRKAARVSAERSIG